MNYRVFLLSEGVGRSQTGIPGVDIETDPPEVSKVKKNIGGNVWCRIMHAFATPS